MYNEKAIWTMEEARKALETQAKRFHHTNLTWDGKTATCSKCKRIGKVNLTPEQVGKNGFRDPYYEVITYEYCEDLIYRRSHPL